jgi:hypothetical protein
MLPCLYTIDTWTRVYHFVVALLKCCSYLTQKPLEVHDCAALAMMTEANTRTFQHRLHTTGTGRDIRLLRAMVRTCHVTSCRIFSVLIALLLLYKQYVC